MFLAKVIGNVVSTQKDEKFIGSKLLIVRKIGKDREMEGEPIVVTDTVGAGNNEIVLVVTGSGARYINTSEGIVPSDASIIGIVDYMEMDY